MYFVTLFRLFVVVPRAGIEPATSSSSGKRYYQLSYLGKII